MKKYILIAVLALTLFPVGAKDYNASLFGIKSNGVTLNTRSIQKAIDYIHAHGGGRLVFYVGRYLTGSIRLKSNVCIHLNEGAVLVGSDNPYDYDFALDGNNGMAFIIAVNADSIGLTGKGVIDGRGREVGFNALDQVHRGITDYAINYDRTMRPHLVFFYNCNQVHIEDVLLKDASCGVLMCEQIKRLTIRNITVKSAHYWNNDATNIADCDDVLIANSHFDCTDDAICLKSYHPERLCQNIVIRDCTARSSASGIKFGTLSVGGFRNVKLSNITVYNTFRSAIALEAVDGGSIEHIAIDSLTVYNTGNIIFLRIGDRRGKKSSMNDIRISNVYAEVAEGKPDAGYEYEGPTEDMPRNISPCIIAGLPGQDISNVHLKNIRIIFPGGGNPHYAKVGLTPAELKAIPELPAVYPEYSQFKELPAWGFYIRHAQGLLFDNVVLTAKKADYRPAIVLDDVKNSDVSGVQIIAPRRNKPQIHACQSSGIKK
jgi:hypothetical protein